MVQPPGSGGTTKRATAAMIANTATGFVNTSFQIVTPTAGGLAGGQAMTSTITLVMNPAGLNGLTTAALADGVVLNHNSSGTPALVPVQDFLRFVPLLTNRGVPNFTTDLVAIIRGSDGLVYNISPSQLAQAAGNLPVGGTTGQFLAKISATNYDTNWQDSSILLAAQALAANPTGTTALGTSLVGTTNQVLRYSTTGTIGFGQINLSSTSSVTGFLNATSYLTGLVSVPFGGTGTSALTAFGILVGNGTSAVQVTTAGTSGQLLIGQTSTSLPIFQSVTGDLTLSSVGTATVATNTITYPKIQTVTALSVLGNSSSAVTNATAIPASAAFQVLQVNSGGTGLAFGALNITASVTGILTVPFGGTGTSNLTAYGVLIGNGTSAVQITTAATAGQLLIGQTSTSLPVFATVTGDFTLSSVGTATIATNAVTYAKFQQMTALSVHANVSSAVANSTALAGTANQILQVNQAGTGLVFALLNITASITGVMTVPFGGTGTSALTAFGVLIGNGTSAVQITTAATAGQLLIGQTSTSIPIFQTIIGDITLSALGTATIAANAVTYDKFQTMKALSVHANTSSTTANSTALSGTANQILQVNQAGTGLIFGSVNLTASVSGVLTVTNGGSGASSLTANGVLVGNGTAAISPITSGTAGYVLTSNGTAIPTWEQPGGLPAQVGLSAFGNTSTATAVPAAIIGTANQVLRVNAAGTTLEFGTLNLTAGVSGILAVGNGGSGTTTLTAFGVVVGNGTSSLQVTSAGSGGQLLIGQTTTSLPTFATMTGDVTLASTGTATIAANAVTYAKFQTMTALSVHANVSSAVANSTALAGTTSQVLQVNQAGTGLIFGTVNLTASVAGVLAVGNGGVGTSALTLNAVLLGNGTSALGLVTAGTSTWVLTANGTASAPTWQAAASGAPVAGDGISVSGSTVSINTNNAGGIGSYALLVKTNAGAIAPGNTTAGSQLNFWYITGGLVVEASIAPPGTWRNYSGVGVASTGTTAYGGFWIRTA